MNRRALEFEDFDDVAKEADRLLAQGYRKTGDWDLTQVCNHLTEAMTRSVTTGVRPMVSLPLRWYLRWRYLNRVLETKKFKSGVKAPSEVENPPTGDPAAAVQRLRAAAAQVNAYQGEFHPHPYFGYLTPDQARRFHLIHCAHHLSFLTPS